MFSFLSQMVISSFCPVQSSDYTGTVNKLPKTLLCVSFSGWAWDGLTLGHVLVVHFEGFPSL